MQFRNLFLFIVLSSGVMIGWQQFVLKPQQLAREKARIAQQQVAEAEVAKAAAAAPRKADEKPVEARKPDEAGRSRMKLHRQSLQSRSFCRRYRKPFRSKSSAWARAMRTLPTSSTSS